MKADASHPISSTPTLPATLSQQIELKLNKLISLHRKHT